MWERAAMGDLSGRRRNELPTTTPLLRESNFELLRILAMLAIVTFHIVNHSVVVELTDADSMARMGNAYFNQPVIYKRLWILYSIMPWGAVSNALFVLISGYFLVGRGPRLDVGRTARKLLVQQAFAAVVLTVGSTVAYQVVQGLGHGYVDLQGITVFNFMSWFVGYYFLVVLIAACGLNRWLDARDRDEYRTFLLVMLALSQLSWSGAMAESLASGLRTLLTGVFLYALGGYVRRYEPFASVRAGAVVAVILAAYALIWVSDYNEAAVLIEDYARSASQDPFVQSVHGYDNCSAVCLVIAVAVFELFRRLRMRPNRVVNYIGASTFMVYLLHDNALVYSLWDLVDWIALLHESPLGFVGRLAACALVTFAVGVAFYALYAWVAGAVGSRAHARARGEAAR